MQIAPGLYSIGQKKGGNVHAYLIDDGGFLTLIDTPGKLVDAGGAEIVCVGHGGPITRGGSSILRQLRDGKKPAGVSIANDIGN